MAKQPLHKRIQNAFAAPDPRARWKKIKEDLPDECAVVEQILGPMPVGDLNDIDIKKAVYYAARDADATCRVDPALDSRHRDMGLSIVESVDMGAVPLFCRMQSNGIAADKKHFEDLSALFDVLINETVDKINRIGGVEINPGSGDQVAFLLFGVLGLVRLDEQGRPIKPKRTKSGEREATDEKVLQGMRDLHPVIPHIIQFRELQKLKGTYSDKIPKLIQSDGRIYGDLRITRTPTGQLAIGEPNLLAMPTSEIGKEIRRGFVAPPGRILASFDYGQFHFRVAAHLSGDERMCRVFTEGRDLHKSTASDMFGVPIEQLTDKHRRPAKIVGFGILNGMTAKGVSAQFDMAAEQGAEPHSEQECQQFIDSWFDVYQGVRQFQRDAVCEARRFGFVRDYFGRIRYLPNIHSAIPVLREEAERQAFSHKIQGTAHGVLKRAMAELWGYLQDFWVRHPRFRLEPLLQIHDEILWELSDGMTNVRARVEEEVRGVMCGAVGLRVPLVSSATFAYNWGDLK